MKDQHSVSDDEPGLADDDDSGTGEDQHLITVDELRAAGALDVPAAWRKSLGVERDLFSGLFGDDDTLPEQQLPAPRDPDGNGSADELP